jgi:hypothetical protein
MLGATRGYVVKIKIVVVVYGLVPMHHTMGPFFVYFSRDHVLLNMSKFLRR